MNKEDFDIVFYGIDKYSVDDLIANNPSISTVAWCGGFVLILRHIESNKFDEYLVEQNKRIFAGLDYAEMSQYQPTLTSEYNGKIHIMNHSNTKTFQRIVEFLHTKHSMEQKTS